MKNIGIYKITNLKNNKVYIGSSSRLRQRKHEHFKYLKNNKHCNTHLQKSYNKYGKEKFIFEIIEEVLFNEDSEILKINLLEREQYWLDKYFGENCYNLLPVAGSKLGSKASEETKKKLSESQKGNKYCLGNKASEETKQKMSASAKNKSDDVRKRTSNTLKGHEVSEETRRKISEKQKGKFVSEETRRKLSESHKGHKQSKEAIEKIRQGNKNKIVSEETKKKMGEAKKGNKNWLGKKHSEETKRKIGKANSRESRVNYD